MRTIIITDKLSDNVVSRASVERSQQKYKEGLRSPFRVVHQGKLLQGSYLLSTYIGGTVAVITTPHWLWAGMTDEMSPGMQRMILKKHGKIASPFAFSVDKNGNPAFIDEQITNDQAEEQAPDEQKPSIRDGQHRFRGGLN